MRLNASCAVVSQELAVLRAYLRGALSGLDTRLRNGPLQAGDEAIAACLVSALDRLPTHQGVVFHRAPSGDLPLEVVFFPGSLLSSRPSPGPSGTPSQPTESARALWSTT